MYMAEDEIHIPEKTIILQKYFFLLVTLSREYNGVVNPTVHASSQVYRIERKQNIHAATFQLLTSANSTIEYVVMGASFSFLYSTKIISIVNQ
jgi:hypothetical protein